MSAVVGLLILFPFIGQSKDNNVSDVSTVSPDHPEKGAETDTGPENSVTNEYTYLYSEFSKGAR